MDEEKHNEKVGILYALIFVITLIIVGKSFMIFNLVEDNTMLVAQRDRVLKAFNACDTQLQMLSWLKADNNLTKPAE